MRTTLSRLLLLSFAILFAAPAPATRVEAKLQGKVPPLCSAGEVWDPRNGGECWQCPAGYARSLYPVTSATKACTQWTAERLSKATYHHRTGCGSGEFFDPRGGGECWQCPPGYPRRTAHAVNDPKACATAQLIGEKLSAATFKGKVGKCTGIQFSDPRNGGECWSCPADTPRRTLNPVTGDKACAQKELPGPASEKLAGATFRSSHKPFACPSGQFWDPRNGGECWSCPAPYTYRTMNPVYGKEACTDKPAEIFPDPAMICRAVVTGFRGARSGLKEGQDELDKALGLINDILAPFLKEVQGRIAQATDVITSATKLDDLLDKLAAATKSEATDRMRAAVSRIKGQEEKFIGMLLDEKVLCEGRAGALAKAMQDLGAPLKTSSASDFFMGSANAATAARGDRFMMSFSIFATGTLKSPPIGGDVGVTFMTGFSQEHALYVTFGPHASSAVRTFGAGYGVMFYPQASVGPLDYTAFIPGVSLSLSAGPKIAKYYDKLKKLKYVGAGYALPDTLDVSIDNFAALASGQPPTFGVGFSRVLVEPIQGTSKSPIKFVDGTAGIGWSIPLWYLRKFPGQ